MGEEEGEEELVARAQTGDRRALDLLARRCAGHVDRALMRFRWIDETTKLDLRQVALLNVSRRIGTFRSDSKLSTWTFRVASNVALMHLRAQRRQKSRVLADVEVDNELVVSDVFGRTAARPDAISPVQVETLSNAARSILTRSERKLVDLYYGEDLPLERVAERAGLTESAARSRVHRARAKMRRYLAEQGITSMEEGEDIVPKPSMESVFEEEFPEPPVVEEVAPPPVVEEVETVAEAIVEEAMSPPVVEEIVPSPLVETGSAQDRIVAFIRERGGEARTMEIATAIYGSMSGNNMARASAQLSSMMKKGKVERVRVGLYRVLSTYVAKSRSSRDPLRDEPVVAIPVQSVAQPVEQPIVHPVAQIDEDEVRMQALEKAGFRRLTPARELLLPPPPAPVVEAPKAEEEDEEEKDEVIDPVIALRRVVSACRELDGIANDLDEVTRRLLRGEVLEPDARVLGKLVEITARGIRRVVVQVGEGA